MNVTFSRVCNSNFLSFNVGLAVGGLNDHATCMMTLQKALEVFDRHSDHVAPTRIRILESDSELTLYFEVRNRIVEHRLHRMIVSLLSACDQEALVVRNYAEGLVYYRPDIVGEPWGQFDPAKFVRP